MIHRCSEKAHSLGQETWATLAVEMKLRKMMGEKKELKAHNFTNSWLFLYL